MSKKKVQSVRNKSYGFGIKKKKTARNAIEI